MRLPASVTVVDVGLRDGLQNEPGEVSTQGKLRLARALVAAGIREMEVTRVKKAERAAVAQRSA